MLYSKDKCASSYILENGGKAFSGVTMLLEVVSALTDQLQTSVKMVLLVYACSKQVAWRLITYYNDKIQINVFYTLINKGEMLSCKFK